MTARLARVLFVVVLLAGWQAALEHPIEHASHEETGLCHALDALTACTGGAQAVFPHNHANHESPYYPLPAPRVAEAPPFLSQGPPLASV